MWDIRPESARRVGHPAPFPVELPQRLIELYTFRDDLVLDPFLGSGTTAVAAVRTGRRFVGYDTDPTYIEIAAQRVAEENEHLQSPSTEEGKAAQALGIDILTAAGFEILERDHRVPGVGILVDVVARDAGGAQWYFDVTGAFTSTPGGLLRTDTLWKCLGRASVLRAEGSSPSCCCPPTSRHDVVPGTRRCAPSVPVVSMTWWGCWTMLTGGGSSSTPRAGTRPGPFRGSGPPPTSGPRPERGCPSTTVEDALRRFRRSSGATP